MIRFDMNTSFSIIFDRNITHYSISVKQLLHKSQHVEDKNKRKKYLKFNAYDDSNLRNCNNKFSVFSTQIINLYDEKNFYEHYDYLETGDQTKYFHFLGIVLLLSFIKQVYNYLFVAVDKQNYLLRINLFRLIIWVIIWVITIPKRWLGWWVITQTIIEILFVLWAIFIGTRHKINPIISTKLFYKITSILILFSILWYILTQYIKLNVRSFLFTELFSIEY